MIKVTFWTYSRILEKEFINIEIHKSADDARLRATAFNWKITKIEEV